MGNYYFQEVILLENINTFLNIFFTDLMKTDFEHWVEGMTSHVFVSHCESNILIFHIV